MTAHIQFRIGNHWIGIEDRTGYAQEHPDYVTFALREAKPIVGFDSIDIRVDVDNAKQH